MFRGINTVSLDSKGRISIPVKHRDALTHLVVVPNPVQDEKCLLIYPIREWEKVEAEITSRPNTKSVRSLKRFFLGQAIEYTLDSNGRILLPQPLRDFANIDKKTVLIGQGNKFELWNESHWSDLRDEFLADITNNDLSEELEGLTF